MYEIATYLEFVKNIKELIYRHQYDALKVVNRELMSLYWEIGKEISSRQADNSRGKSIVDDLSMELQKEFLGVKGFSPRNLWNMRNFYKAYADNVKLQPMVAEIGWSKNIIIMERCENDLEREFYIRMVKLYGWTKDVLINNLSNNAYHKYLLNQTNFDETVPEEYRLQAKLAVKDDYNFDFLEMGLQHSEAELEVALIKSLQNFLSELGGSFAFLGSQYHLSIEGNDYYIDLLLFHRRLQSLIAIELKIGEFKPEYAGKMQFYLTALDATVKFGGESPSIGIIVCKSKKRTVVEYALKNIGTPIGVATYNMYTELPEEMRELLPSPEEIMLRLEALGAGVTDESLQ